MRPVVIFLLSILLTIPAELARGTTFIPKDFNQLIVEAEQIFVGTVTDTRARKLPSGAIVTDVTLSNLRILKGDGAREITLQVLGGTVDRETLQVAGFPQFELGKTYLIFSKDNGKVILPLVGGDQGLFQIKRDPSTGDELVFSAQGIAITSPTVREAIGVPAFEKDRFLPSPITLDAFVQAIMNRLGR